MTNYKILLFYKYINIADTQALKKEFTSLCQKNNLTGRVIIAQEGINAILEGTEKEIDNFVQEFSQDPNFSDVHFKYSQGTGEALPKLSVKIRPEIVAARLGKDDFSPTQYTGKYLTIDELHQWFENKKEFYIVDMRNDFEFEVGHFENSIFSGMLSFADLPKVLPKLKSLKNKTILTVCTGGVRCEKASGFLVKNGFSDVYQLYGGIHTYIEKYPNQQFKGSLYTFDQRVVMGFNMDDPNRVIIGKCAKCKSASEHYINCLDPFCNRHMIVCETCLDGKDKILCPQGCRDYSREHPELFRNSL